MQKYLNLARELKKTWNIKVTVIPIVAGVLRMVPKGVEKGLDELKMWKNQVHPRNRTALLRLSRILRRILMTQGDFLFIQTPVKTTN